MARATTTLGESQSLRDPRLKEKLQTLRRTDNVTNLYYLGRTWLLLALVIGGTVLLVEWLGRAGLAVWWSVPAFLLAIPIIGASQHQLAGATHEATHYMLFRHRLLGELVSDWFCMFPLFSSTYHFRLHHLAHHQFINDPERDPDFSQLARSGHWLPFPVSKQEFLGLLARQLWLPNLLKYVVVRALYNSLSTEKNPYTRGMEAASKWQGRLGIGTFVTSIAVVEWAKWSGNWAWLALAPAAVWVTAVLLYWFLPDRWFEESRLLPVYSLRLLAISRITFVIGLFAGLAWLNLLTGRRAGLFFLLLWLAPLLTTFPLFMMLRQVVQHGNCDRGWLTNTRVFLVNPLVRYAVFPFGMDYHLPHHMYATVPHYRLPKLHEALLEYPEYRAEAVVVEGYFLPLHQPPQHPTVLEVLGPDYAPRAAHEPFIDDSVLDRASA